MDVFFFFFSSRRRHTRSLRDWSSDVCSSDLIEAPADLEILNPDLEIANLSSKGRLEVTLTIGRGRGYVPAEGNRGQAHTIGEIGRASCRKSVDLGGRRISKRKNEERT